MSMVVDEQSVKQVVKAFVEATTDDRTELRVLVCLLQSLGPKTGLGYIITDAMACVEQKLQCLNPRVLSES